MNFAALFAALKEIGYTGNISAECLPLPDKMIAARSG
jgi:sugar phosphate isomerase/epimerase